MANAIKSTGNNKTGGVTVLTELERFVEVGTISKKQKDFLSAGSVGLVSKSILNDIWRMIWLLDSLIIIPWGLKGLGIAGEWLLLPWSSLPSSGRSCAIWSRPISIMISIAGCRPWSASTASSKRQKKQGNIKYSQSCRENSKVMKKRKDDGMSDLETKNKILREIGIQSGQQSLRDVFSRRSSST